MFYALHNRDPEHARHRDLLQRRVCDVLNLWDEQFPSEAESWAVAVGKEMYRREIITLIPTPSICHFHGTRAYLEQLESFSMVELGKHIKSLTPILWALAGTLLNGLLW